MHDRKVKCKFCNSVCSGGIFRFKHHLARTRNNVAPCDKVPENVRLEFCRLLEENDMVTKKKRGAFSASEDDEVYERQARGNNLENNVTKKGKVQSTMNSIFKKEERERVCQQIARSRLIFLLKEFTKGKELLRPGATRFATSYLTLGRLFELKRFWSSVITCLRAAKPLMKVLRLVDSDSKPAMGFIYQAMVNAKKEIANFKDNQTRYEPIYDIIDDRWYNQMNRAQHVAGYYLNPHMQYSDDFENNGWIKSGLYMCLERICGADENLPKTIDCQFINSRMQEITEEPSSNHDVNEDDDFLERAIRDQLRADDGRDLGEDILDLEEEDNLDAQFVISHDQSSSNMNIDHSIAVSNSCSDLHSTINEQSLHDQSSSCMNIDHSNSSNSRYSFDFELYNTETFKLVPYDKLIHKKPFKGLLFDSLDIGLDFYKTYGQESDFDVNMSSQKRYNDGTIRIRYSTCSRSGFTESFKNENINVKFSDVKRMRNSSKKNGCPAVSKFKNLRCSLI
ncbi:unnamed protein product [Lactuca virosa]|uniref:BED-type domain-containing protein n=1 Tax=Lactuca virosa TaxID=75947 RepID=A0AAU9ME98_9ASTR|nr:unnamed protein product [Lactuca virosa]